MQRLIETSNPDKVVDKNLEDLITLCLNPLNLRISLKELEEELQILKTRSDLIDLSNYSMQITFFLSMINLLQCFHAKKVFLISIRPKKVYYNATTGLSSIILCETVLSMKDEPINSNFFECSSLYEMDEKANCYKHIAPECWSLVFPPPPTEAMDLYSLGFMMRELLQDKIIPEELTTLLQNCLNPNHSLRVTLSDLKSYLEALQTIITVQSEIKLISVDFSTDMTKAQISTRKTLLFKSIDEKLQAQNLLEAYDQLNIVGGHHPMILDAYDEMHNAISSAAEERKKGINPIHSGFFKAAPLPLPGNSNDNSPVPPKL